MFERRLAHVATLISLAVMCASAVAQTYPAPFGYQGQLSSNGAPVNTPTDFKFSIYDAATRGTQVSTTAQLNAVPVTNGLFSVEVPFGALTGNADAPWFGKYLQIEVRNPTGVGSFVSLTSRQKILATPYSLATRGFNCSYIDGYMGLGGNYSAWDDLTIHPKAAYADGVAVRFKGSPFAIFDWRMVSDETEMFIATVLPNSNTQTKHVVIKDTGKVGIGTSTPSARLEIRSTTPNDQMLVLRAPTGVVTRYIDTNGGLGWDMGMGNGGWTISRSGIDYPFIIRGDTGGVSINNGGNVTAGFMMEVGGSIRCVGVTQTSARELKQDIAPLTGALESIMQLQGVSYAWNDKAPESVRGQHDIGFLADEVNAVLPDIVAKDENGKPVGIDYGKIAPVAVEAIKQLKAENDDLKARLEKLEALVAAQAAKDIK